MGSAPVRIAGPDEDPFALLDEQPDVAPPGAERGAGAAGRPAWAGAGEAVVGGGWFGLLGYGLGAGVEVLPPGPPRARPLPRHALAFHDHVLVAEAEGSWFFEALWTPTRAAALAARRDELARRLASAPRPRPARLRDVRLRAPGAAGHERAVAACVERIAAGEVFQANLCLTLDARLEGRPADAAATLAATLQPAHGAFLAGPWGALASASPELFLRRVGREVLSAPIKGTAPLGDPRLAGSEKDRAEHVMIVDLMRNDLGRVCEYGSVRVTALEEERPGAGVAHLVSDVRGRLRSGTTDAELLRASFPPGSVTGAPKVQAQRVIAEEEAAGREAYTGALGFASPLAGLELSVVIRTLEVVGDEVQLGVGGGITSGSDPAAELAECATKATPLLRALGADWPEPLVRCIGGRSDTRCSAEGLLLALAEGRDRPDPARGLFETLLVRDGVPRRLDAHLARLAASAATVLGLGDVTAEATAVIAEAASRVREGRLRVDLAADGAITTTVGPVPRASGPVLLAPVLLAGGLGAHKWADRRLVDQLTEALGAVPLFVDGDGAVLEAGWATVWLREGDRWVTPVADGRILPGVARAALLAERADTAEEPVDLARLRAADAVALSTVLRSLAPAALLAVAPA